MSVLIAMKMKKIIQLKTIFIFLFLGIILFSPFIVLAQPNAFPNDAWTPQDVVNLVGLIRNMFLIIGVISLVIFIIWAGMGFFTAQGNPTKIQEAKKRLLWTLVATAIILGTYVIILSIRAFIGKDWL